jgi:hypothetical protein
MGLVFLASTTPTQKKQTQDFPEFYIACLHASTCFDLVFDLSCLTTAATSGVSSARVNDC